jgi:hypothetical protein
MLVNPEPPHHITQSVYLVANLADLVLGTGALTSEQEASLRAQLAFMAYVLNWRGYRHPKTRKFLKYYLAMQTPPDPEFNHQRGLVQIGNSYVFETVDDLAMWARGMADVDGIELSGIAGSFSQRGAVRHYMIEHRTRLSAEGLGVACNLPVDLIVGGNAIKGRCNALDAVPVLTLTGPVAQRAKSVTIASDKTKSLTLTDGCVQIPLPLGDTTFEIALQ